MQLILVGIGGFLGAIARYGIGRLMAPQLSATTASTIPAWPWATLMVNASGSFLIGLAVVLPWFSASDGASRLLFITGFLGAYTTFSTFSLETLMLFESGFAGRALLNVGLNLLLCLLFVWLGNSVGRLLIH